MKNDLSGKTALVTGGAKRIGKAVALALAGRGVHVAVHYNRSGGEAEKTAAEIREYGVKAWTVGGDLSDGEETKRIVPLAKEKAGRIDILVNNASVFGESRLRGIDIGDFERTLAVNAIAPLVLSEAFAGQTDSGVIVNFLDSRIAAWDLDRVAYQVSKNMLYHLTGMTAAAYAPDIRVNAVAPGVILPPPGKDESVAERLGKLSPLKRRGTLEDVTDAVLFLVGHDYLTGEVLYVDGGLNISERSNRRGGS